MNILVIGNGFDLAHRLPTSYMDFLDFVYSFMEQYCPDDLEKFSNYKNFRKNTYEEFILRLKDNAKMQPLAKELYSCINYNKWFRHFMNKTGMDGWVDFEKEISKIIKALDDIYFSVPQNGSHELTRSQVFILQACFSWNRIDEKTMTLKQIQNCKEELLDDLNKLTRCLEIFLEEYVNQVPKSIELPDIKHLKVDKLLSFNYTNTYERFYHSALDYEQEHDFIHGKASADSNINNCNLILGINEYLDSERRDTDNEFIQFKKFYQRIFKKTGCTYMDWIDISRNDDEELQIYILGHSLDVTDKDILCHLIMTEGAKTTIYYHSKEALGKLIGNLVKIIGQHNLISKVHGKQATIIFQELVQPQALI